MNKYIGSTFQLYGVEKYQLLEGKAKGMDIYHVKNGKGLEFCVSLDRNGDLSSLTYRGVNISYLSPVGYVNSKYYDANGIGFLKSFTAGFLTTCGLQTVGTPTNDAGVDCPLHGTIGNTPVICSSYEVNDEFIMIKTKTIDESMFGIKLILNRKIRVSLLENMFEIDDVVENTGDKVSPLMILYHMNLGYPFLDEKLKLIIQSNNVEARNEHALKGINERNKMQTPTDNYEEMCYYHSIKDNGCVMAFNEKFNFGLKMTFSKNLDSFVEWKMMGVRDYVLGLEPGNSYPDGRSNVRKDGKLKFISPGEKINYKIKIKIIDINEFKTISEEK
jgi:hypothetical protein